jgi:F420-0:gamma-glutamyl ligase
LLAFLPPLINSTIGRAQRRRLSERAVLQGGMDKASPVPALALFALSHFPLIEPGADIGGVICRLCEAHGPALLDRDVVVVAQKIVSKAEGRYVDLVTVKPGEHALALAEQVQKDPRLVEVILGESRRVLRHRPGVLIVEHKLGSACPDEDSRTHVEARSRPKRKRSSV